LIEKKALSVTGLFFALTFFALTMLFRHGANHDISQAAETLGHIGIETQLEFRDST
jgi:hypothetical protein